MNTPLTFAVAAVALEACAFLVIMIKTAIGRVTHARTEEMVDFALPGAARLAIVLADRARYVAVMQLVALTLAATGGVLITAAFLFAWPSDGWALTAAAVVVALVGFVALGVMPETLGLQRADTIARRGAGIAWVLGRALWPLARGLVALGNAITPGRGYRSGPFASEADVRELIDMAEEGELIEADERQMLHSVFELGDTIAREVMVPRTEMVWVESDKTLNQALSLFLRSGFSRIPVIGEDSDDVIGVVYLKDVARRVYVSKEPDPSETVQSLMRKPFYVPESKPADEVLKEMQAARVHIAMVIDEYGGTAGLVTIEDILEEIVGEITDEYDNEIPEVEKLADDSYRVSSRLHVDDLADLLGVDIESSDEGVETVLGLFATRLGKVPIPGAQIDLEGWQLTAETRAGRRNRVSTVSVSRKSGH